MPTVRPRASPVPLRYVGVPPASQLRQQLRSQVRFDPAVLDRFLMPVCRFGRAWRCRRLAALAAFGRDEDAKQTYYGLRAHLRVCWPEVITNDRLVPANLHDLAMAEELLAGAQGWPLGDRASCSPVRAGLLATRACGCWPRRHGRPGGRCRTCPAG
jgi:hypothetical protein